MGTKIGITIKNLNKFLTNDSWKFGNGLDQNIMYFYNYFSKNDIYEPYLIVEPEDYKTGTVVNSSDSITISWIDTSDISKLKELKCLICIGFTPCKTVIQFMKKSRIISLQLGNIFVTNTLDMLNTGSNSLFIDKESLYDEIWISPHFVYSIDYYKYIYQTEKVFSAPYIWEPEYIGEPYTEFNHDSINIGVFESNFAINKSCFIPIIICDKAKEFINKTYICCTDKLLQSEHFTKFAKLTALVKEKRITFLGRHKFKNMMDKHCNVVVSFNENWDLNYLTLECFYLGIPIVHNSKMLKDWGYYYEGCDVSTAVRHLKFIKESFNRQAYINRHKQILFKYSMQNPEYIDFFKSRILDNSSAKLKFIHITKCAGSSIEEIGKKHNILWGRYHKEYGHHHDVFINKSTELKLKFDWFVVVRNPYTRLISEFYCYYTGIGNIPNGDVDISIDKFNAYMKARILNRYNHKKTIMSGMVRGHYIEQYKYIDDNIPIHIIHFENIEIEFNKLMKDYNLDISLNKKSNTCRYFIKKFNVNSFSPELIELINKVYHKDFITFGYTKIDP